MKTIFRSLGLGFVLTVLIAVGAGSAFAQEPTAEDIAQKTATYEKFLEVYNKPDAASRKQAVELAKQFIEKWGSNPDDKPQVDYLKTYIVDTEKWLAQQEITQIVQRFDASLKSKNWDETYSAGKELLAKKPNDDNYRAALLVLGSIGLDETAKKPAVTKYNDDTIRYAKMAIADLESGKTFKTYGVAPFAYKDKEDALAWMNYTIGYIMMFDKGNKQEGSSYMYKATQFNTPKAKDPVIYSYIGDVYWEEARKKIDELKTLNANLKPEDPVEVKEQKDAEIKAKLGVLNGYLERAMDAYGRAYQLTDAAKSKPAKDNLYNQLKTLYSVRFPDRADGLDAYISSIVTKPMPNPTSTVTPVNDPETKTDDTATTGVN